MKGGKLYTANVVRQQDRVSFRCCCCGEGLGGAEVIRADDNGHRRFFVVACPRCGKYMSYYRTWRVA